MARSISSGPTGRDSNQRGAAVSGDDHAPTWIDALIGGPGDAPAWTRRRIPTILIDMDGKLPAAVSWPEPPGIAPRGTLIVIPGRGEQPGVYERFGRRISADGYRVHVVT